MTQPQHDDADRVRLDLLLTQAGHFETRARARDAVARGSVQVNGQLCTKPGTRVQRNSPLSVCDGAQNYVSRAALKLIAGLDHFEFDVSGHNALDIGASTGGFSQVLLERGAAHVTAVDVGHGQLHPSLEHDRRISSHEGVNARALDPSILAGRTIGILVSDVSFISLKLALPPALKLASEGCFCILLVKPQFEAGREAIGKGGLLKDPDLGPEIAKDMAQWLDSQPGWKSIGTIPSPISGSDGNLEYLLGGIKS